MIFLLVCNDFKGIGDFSADSCRVDSLCNDSDAIRKSLVDIKLCDRIFRGKSIVPVQNLAVGFTVCTKLGKVQRRHDMLVGISDSGLRHGQRGICNAALVYHFCTDTGRSHKVDRCFHRYGFEGDGIALFFILVAKTYINDFHCHRGCLLGNGGGCFSGFLIYRRAKAEPVKVYSESIRIPCFLGVLHLIYLHGCFRKVSFCRAALPGGSIIQ